MIYSKNIKFIYTRKIIRTINFLLRILAFEHFKRSPLQIVRLKLTGVNTIKWKKGLIYCTYILWLIDV